LVPSPDKQDQIVGGRFVGAYGRNFDEDVPSPWSPTPCGESAHGCWPPNASPDIEMPCEQLPFCSTVTVIFFFLFTMLESKNGVADLVKPLRGAYEPSSSLFIARFLAKFRFA
jgi:hypothetical protein